MQNPGKSRGFKLTFCSAWEGLRVSFDNLLAFNGYCAFNQYGDLIVNDFYEATLDREIGEVVVLVLQNLYPAGFQGADQRRMSVEHFKQAVYAGQLYAIHVGAEQFLLGC